MIDLTKSLAYDGSKGKIRIMLSETAQDRLDRTSDRRAARILLEFIDWDRNPEIPTVRKGHYGIHWLLNSRGQKVVGLVLDRRRHDRIVVIDITGDLGRRRRRVNWPLVAATIVLAMVVLLFLWVESW